MKKEKTTNNTTGIDSTTKYFNYSPLFLTKFVTIFIIQAEVNQLPHNASHIPFIVFLNSHASFQFYITYIQSIHLITLAQK